MLNLLTYAACDYQGQKGLASTRTNKNLFTEQELQLAFQSYRKCSMVCVNEWNTLCSLRSLIFPFWILENQQYFSSLVFSLRSIQCSFKVYRISVPLAFSSAWFSGFVFAHTWSSHSKPCCTCNFWTWFKTIPGPTWLVYKPQLILQQLANW